MNEREKELQKIREKADDLRRCIDNSIRLAENVHREISAMRTRLLQSLDRIIDQVTKDK